MSNKRTIDWPSEEEVAKELANREEPDFIYGFEKALEWLSSSLQPDSGSVHTPVNKSGPIE